MTSVAVISSAVVRINCLKGQFETLPDGADELLGVLNEVKESLINADGEKADVERDIVNLSHDIVDAIADAVVSKTAFRDLKDPLIRLHNKLKNIPEPEPEPKQERIDKKIKSRVSCILRVASVLGCLRRPDTEKQTTSEQNRESENKKVENSDISLVARILRKAKKILTHKEKEDSVSDIDIVEWKQGNSSPVLYIVGESGMGKSTCARRLFDELRNHSSYDVCTWVSINHNFKRRRVLQVLLHKLTPRQGLAIGDMNEMELIAQISSILKQKNYLLVLDDVRSVRDWESFRIAVPISGSNRVIITSSDMDFTSPGAVYKIPSRTLSGIHKLLKEEGSFQPENHVETIFNASGGSPLLATILGKSLQSEATPARRQHLVDELNCHKPLFGEPTVLAACYKWLAPELKPCLLYLSQFPRGQEIEVEKLYLLLAAESLIFSAESLIFSPEESKRCLNSLIDHLDELARRNLVEVHEDIRSRISNNKSYGLQFQVQEFCISKASKENFLEIVDMESPTTVKNYTRRLVIHLSKTGGNVSIQFESQVILKEIMSLLIYDTSKLDEEKSKLPKEINDLKEFIHLRILKFDGVNFDVHNAPTGIDTLVLLRYLSFRGCRLKELPSSLSKLTQLETLDLVVQADCEMLIHNNILTHMKRMLHLYFPKLYKRSDDKTKIQLKNLESLEILVNFDAEVCDVGALPKFKQLIILSTMSDGDPGNLNVIADFINTQADLLKYSSVDIRSFDYYDNERVLALEKLLKCKFIHSMHIEGRIGKLPEPKEDNRKNNTLDNVVGSSGIEANPEEDNRKTKISDIVLDGSEIEADPMKYLGMFENLQSLVLKNDAIVENVIVIPKSATTTLFSKLRSLKLQNLNYLQTLTIEKGAMPKLSSLQIDSCASLEKLSIPKELDDRLKKAQGDDERNVYSIMPLPTGFEITE